MKHLTIFLLTAILMSGTLSIVSGIDRPGAGGATIGLYRTFEVSIENKNKYSNRFTDVELKCIYTSPSGQKTSFPGFFDGDGNGGGDKSSGTIWKLRFMPDEIGHWKYEWSWSDGSAGGKGSFSCVSDKAGKGILRAYKKNPRWFAYNSTEPVWIKSYYETGHGAIAQPFDWIIKNVYQPLLDNGYNHLQVNWLLPLCCEVQYYHDGPPRSVESFKLYENGKASSTMNFNVWKMMEKHVHWLNDRNVGLHMFLGFDGGRNGGPSWSELREKEKDFYVRYVVARLAPYANIAGWNFVWEVDGHRESHELGLARLLVKYDVFNHLRTYEDEKPRKNEYNRPEYTFAAIENHRINSDKREPEMWKQPWTHHEACLLGYIPGKPVYMSEGNALWRRYWAKRCGATQDDLRRSAWACVTAGASFCWNGHSSENQLEALGPEGLPFNNDAHPYRPSAKAIDILGEIMNKEVTFYRMTPHDDLLEEHDSKQVWCLAEPGRQYLVFAANGESFSLDLERGKYSGNQWIDAKTGETKPMEDIDLANGMKKAFTPPDTKTDWILLVRESRLR